MRVRAVEDDEVPILEGVGAAGLEEDRDHLLALRLFVLGQVHADLLPHVVLGPELLLLPRGVVPHHAVRGAEDGLGRAIVLGQAEHRGLGERLLEGEDVLHVGAAPAVDRLVVVPHHGQVPMDPGEALDEAELNPVRVLVLVHEDVNESRGVGAVDLLVQLEETHGEPDEIVEVHGAAITERLLVGAVDLGHAPIDHGERGLLELLRPHALVLQPRDAGSRGRRSQVPVLGPRPLEQIAQNGALVVRIVDHEVLGVAQKLGVASQDPHAGGVEGAQPDPEVLAAEEDLRARPHLARGLVGEGERENRALGDAALAHQVGDAAGQDARLAAPRAGQNQKGTARVFHRLALHGVQVHASPSIRV